MALHFWIRDRVDRGITMGNFHHHKTNRRGWVKMAFVLYKDFLPLTLSFPQSFLQMFGFYLKAEGEITIIQLAGCWAFSFYSRQWDKKTSRPVTN